MVSFRLYQYHRKNLSYCLTYFILPLHEASTHQTRSCYHMAPLYPPQAPETFLGRPQQLSPEFSFRSVLSSTGWRAILMGYCWCLPPDSLEEKN